MEPRFDFADYETREMWLVDDSTSPTFIHTKCILVKQVGGVVLNIGRRVLKYSGVIWEPPPAALGAPRIQ